MRFPEVTLKGAYENYMKNGMRILIDNGVLKGFIRDW